MRPSSGFSLLASNTVVAVIGAVAMLAVAGAVVFDSTLPDRKSDAADPGKSVPPPVHRLAFVPPGVLVPPPPDGDAPALRPGYVEPFDEAETTDDVPSPEETAAWSTELRTEPARPQTPVVPRVRFPWQSKPSPPKPKTYTLRTRLAEIAPAASARIEAKFTAAKAAWPPAELAIIAIKDERFLELHARPKRGQWTMIHRYRVLGASGGPGPKLEQGDKQVPEGVYGISYLNPNSAFHLSLRVNYPNRFDRQMAANDGRKNLGGDIMIHGKNLSAGCLAIGDEAVEELFYLVARTGQSKVKVIIAPTDFRRKAVPDKEPGRPEWLPALYTQVASEMAGFEPPQAIITSSTSSTHSIASSVLSFFTK